MFDLRNNQISGEIGVIGDLTNLEIVLFSNNSFVGPLPENMGTINNLVYFEIENSNFSKDNLNNFQKKNIRLFTRSLILTKDYVKGEKILQKHFRR